jgi:hypothetical protein
MTYNVVSDDTRSSVDTPSPANSSLQARLAAELAARTVAMADQQRRLALAHARFSARRVKQRHDA